MGMTQVSNLFLLPYPPSLLLMKLLFLPISLSLLSLSLPWLAYVLWLLICILTYDVRDA